MAESEAIRMSNIRERAVHKIAYTYRLCDVAAVKSYRQTEEEIFKAAKDENEYFELLARLLLDIHSEVPKNGGETPTAGCSGETSPVATSLPTAAFLTPQSTAVQAKVDEKKQKILMKHLVRLLCASTCLTKKMQPGLNPNRKCTFPNCEQYQEKVKHMMSCKEGKECPHCSSSRRLLSHWLLCNRMMCLICKPVTKLLLVWRAHYDNVFNEREEDCPDVAAITQGVGEIYLINQPKFKTVLRLLQGISLHEKEDLDDVITVINRMDIGDGMDIRGVGSDGASDDNLGMSSVLNMLENISIEEGEFHSMLKLMETTSLSGSQVPAKNETLVKPKVLEDTWTKQPNYAAVLTKSETLVKPKVLEDASKIQADCAERTRHQLLKYYIESSIHSYNCLDNNCHIPSCKRIKFMVDEAKGWQPLIENRYKYFRHLVAIICIHAPRCEDSVCPLPICKKIKEAVRAREKTKPPCTYVSKSQQTSPPQTPTTSERFSHRPIHRVSHHRHVPYVVLHGTPQHPQEQGVRQLVPCRHISGLIFSHKPQPTGGADTATSVVRMQTRTRILELINSCNTALQAQQMLTVVRRIGEESNAFIKCIQQRLIEKQRELTPAQENLRVQQVKNLQELGITNHFNTSHTHQLYQILPSSLASSTSTQPIEEMKHNLEEEKEKPEYEL